MSEFITIAKKITLPLLRDYIITHKIDQGDTIVLNQKDLKELFDEIKRLGEEMPDIPLEMLGVIITQDATDTIPIGKIQIVKNEKPY
ncbi:hypothetical protein FNO01nite_30040 [Flavobacterium noncentrifugens]|uniref:Uncharacterized protein n=1 Tax=Flavobacterium noncentrifugens TaxID=1128970 RepID=A0A1G9BQA7_9FLAO|nr:hypothetical protein [Flavobacterium noncentrifugens]GEP52332.1 hypothetical protein FNO01nite_30040 [Flavobacterium noncentrifugens]SDK41662.1 hypothetical protein SAMN04487935_3314 [Flavobacterium noncentrifugens]